MSKKIAEGTQSLVLDVKVGSGAFMRDLDAARELAQTMVRLGTESGVRTTALLTSMDVPLGRAVGNAVEVAESIETLRGAGPDDLVEVTLALAREMLALAGIDTDPAKALADGRALAKYREMIAGQGGNPDKPLPVARHVQMVQAPATGWLRRLDALAVGTAAWRLGAGRARKEDPVSAGAGVICKAKPGEQVKVGQPLLELRTDEPERFAAAVEALAGASRSVRTRRLSGQPSSSASRESEWTACLLTIDQIRQVPKVLLHDHLDGGLRPATIVDLAQQTGYRGLPTHDPDELGRWMTSAAERGNLELYLEAFQHTVGVMQTRDALVRVAAECAEDLAADGVAYAEVRFAPELHVTAGLSLDQVVEAVLEGFAAGSAGRGIRVYALLTAMRTAARSLEIAELAVRHRDAGRGRVRHRWS